MSDEFAKIDHDLVTKACSTMAEYLEKAERCVGSPDAVKAMYKALVEFNMLLVKLIHIQGDEDVVSAPNTAKIASNLRLLKESLKEASEDTAWFPDMDEYSNWIDTSISEIQTQIQEASDPAEVSKLRQSLLSFTQSMPEIKVEGGVKVYDFGARSKRNTNVLNPIGTRLAQVASDLGLLLAYDGK